MRTEHGSLVNSVTLDVFEADINIVITENPNRFVDDAGLAGWVKENPEQDLMDHTDALTFRVRFSDHYILMSPNVTPGTIAHECIHCISDIFYDRGVKCNLDDSENFAYHVGWLTDVAYKTLNEYLKPNGRKKTIRRNDHLRGGGDNTESPGGRDNQKEQGDRQA